MKAFDFDESLAATCLTAEILVWLSHACSGREEARSRYMRVPELIPAPARSHFHQKPNYADSN